jgi:16S rRNA G1207 methylase RsmC
MLTGANSVAEYMNNVKKSVEDMLQSSSEALSQYNKDVDETNHMAGVETEDYEKEVSDAIITIGKDSAKTREEVAKLSEELKDNFVDSLKEAINWEEEYANKINAAVEANENFIKSINEMIAKLAELESSNPGLEKARTAYQAAELAHEEYVQEWKK